MARPASAARRAAIRLLSSKAASPTPESFQHAVVSDSLSRVAVAVDGALGELHALRADVPLWDLAISALRQIAGQPSRLLLRPQLLLLGRLRPLGASRRTRGARRCVSYDDTSFLPPRPRIVAVLASRSWELRASVEQGARQRR